MSERDFILDEVARAYAGLEGAASFRDPDAIERYRASLLRRSTGQAAFLSRRLRPPARALELACGNGRLLIELARRGVLGSATGTDIAASRIAFASSWAEDLGLPSLRFATEDLLATRASGDCDLTLCITGALGYFEPAEPGLGLQVASRLHDALAPGGLTCVELYPHPGYQRLLKATGGEARVWQELDQEDPWRFYLSDLRLDGDVLTHTKTFVHRHDGAIDEGRRERLLLYTPESLTELLGQAGFVDVELYDGWSEEPYAGGDVLVATAVRPLP
jgi:SAM-dependent methyltransferase